MKLLLFKPLVNGLVFDESIHATIILLCSSFSWIWHAQDREPVRLDQATRQPSSSGINSVSADILSGISHRQRFTGSDRLPGAVLLARERLLARLRGVPLSGNRLVLTSECKFGIS